MPRRRSTTLDLALRECRLFICGSGIGGVRAIHLIGDRPMCCGPLSGRSYRSCDGKGPAESRRDPLDLRRAKM